MRVCEICFRRHWKAKVDKKTGLQVKHKNGNKIFICIRCGHVQEEEIGWIPEKVKANILYIDTEISKSIYYNYMAKVPSKYLRTDDLIQEWYMIGWAASYVGNDTIWSGFVTPKDAQAGYDGNIAGRLHDLMNTAEIIAGHNVDGFDLKKCNTVFLRHKLPPITGKKTIDTLKLCRSKLSLESNRLDYVSQWLGHGGKDDITNDDWKAAMKGDKKTLRKIEEYCRGDVMNGKKVLELLLSIANKREDFGAYKATEK